MSSSEDAAQSSHAMKGISSGAQAWSEPVSIPTYPVMPPDKNPMFLEKRVYQGSSGKVYPLPFVDTVSVEKSEHPYQALHLENEYVYLMLLPEIGGRIQIGFDKAANYDFFYRPGVIKPALVGLAGPWISGGVEFNWPQHHRPGTYMPCEWHLSETGGFGHIAWQGDHDPMTRMKGMHGVCIHPESSLVELKVRLFNRTAHTQTFLWWANVAARVHEQYQSFFPPDVSFVGDHAKRATETFPHVTDRYYGVRYGERGRTGVPLAEKPSRFQPGEEVSPDRLDWYANIPVPTSYMVLATEFNFFGGYDHTVQAGFVHVADRHISPGKKQWTWGNHEFGYAWDRNLSDDEGPYVELMAGVYTDNQPDFSYLAPYETKTFSQFWYPIQRIGIPVNATRDAALAMELVDGTLKIGICPSRRFADAVIEVSDGTEVHQLTAEFAPGNPFFAMVKVKTELPGVSVISSLGEKIVSYRLSKPAPKDPPDTATEPLEALDIASNDELYLTGVHLEQYRHATRAPEPYWEEAIRRDPGDSRCHLALGKRLLQRGLFMMAEEHFRTSIRSLTRRNPNPIDGEASYQLGLSLEFQGRYDDAYSAFAKAAWNQAWSGAAQYACARIECRSRRFESAFDHLQMGRQVGLNKNLVGCLSSAIWRNGGEKTSRATAHSKVFLDTIYDPLDHWALYEESLLSVGTSQEDFRARFRSVMRDDPQNYLDLAFDFGSAGLFEDAIAVLKMVSEPHPMVAYALSYFGCPTPVHGSPDWVFPNRLEEILVLEAAIARDPNDWLAPYLLGNLFYDRKRYEEAIQLWEASAVLNPDYSVVWRNLGIAYHNVLGDIGKAESAYSRARNADPGDARLLYEQDQLWKRAGKQPLDRLKVLKENRDLVAKRDDLSLELCGLLNLAGRPDEAKDILASRSFAPWEGGEGIALGQHTATYSILAKQALEAGHAAKAVELAEYALTAPKNLGEARHLLANMSEVWLLLGDVLTAAAETERAKTFYERAAFFDGDFVEMSVRTYSDKTYYRALALKRLGQEAEADELLAGLASYADELQRTPAKIDYFATSLPTMLLFNEDIDVRQKKEAMFLRAQARLGQGLKNEAERMLQEILADDPNHLHAHQLLEEAVKR